jgi:hypothetical protein
MLALALSLYQGNLLTSIGGIVVVDADRSPTL